MENRACNKEAPGVHSQPGLSLQKTGWGPCLSLLHPTEHWAEPWVVGRAQHREKAEAAPALRQHGRHAPDSPAGRVPQGRLCAAVPGPLVKRGHWGRGWGRDSGPDLRPATWSCAASGGPLTSLNPNLSSLNGPLPHKATEAPRRDQTVLPKKVQRAC